jgi:septal ring factor EnvC (AmiA/AmiB activator)
MSDQNVKTYYKTEADQSREASVEKQHAERRELNQQKKREQTTTKQKVRSTVNKAVGAAKRVVSWAVTNNAKWKEEHDAERGSPARKKKKRRTSTRTSTRSRSAGSGIGDPFSRKSFGDPFSGGFGGQDRFRPPF